ncbi:hypothetical protein FD46_GL000652 [Liquorilactobacillus oeni DSM 19972]|uniref:Uncharacterized protein n=1 Tax=Liquorilactobacillus oeni DSM 19972 TaxID=1423777 RepID=A0A0R1MIY1_9LACO|nr:hypothetical protein FD46_GL000652 [Liquorilactobacillus oeni DSM 19972]
MEIAQEYQKLSQNISFGSVPLFSCFSMNDQQALNFDGSFFNKQYNHQAFVHL